MDPKALLRKRQRIYKHIPRSPQVIRGSLVWMKRICGYRRCRCQKGYKHISLYLSQSQKGKTKMTYVSQPSQTKLAELVHRYWQIRKGLDELSEVNLQLLIGKKP